MLISNDMRAREFDDATIEGLQAEADRYLEEADSPEGGDDAERLRLLFKAQFYLTAVARKRDDETSRRDFKMEKVVIILISVEIVLSLIFGGWGLYEGIEQADILDKMKTSAAATATSISQLVGDQAASRQSLEQMNKELQQSLTLTSGMASAMSEQLRLLRTEQQQKLQQLSKRPKLVLYIGNVPADTMFKVPYTQRENTDTTVSFDCSFVNEGDATATRPLLRVVILDKDVTLTSSTNVQRPAEPLDSPMHTFLLQMDNMRPHTRIPFVLTFVFPKGHTAFGVLLNADADEIETGTRVGTISITPRKPLN